MVKILQMSNSYIASGGHDYEKSSLKITSQELSRVPNEEYLIEEKSPLNSADTKSKECKDIYQQEDLALDTQVDIVDNQGQKVNLDKLSEAERTKLVALQKSVTRNAYPYSTADVVQFLIVSDLDITKSLTRMDKWQGILKKYKADKVEFKQALGFLSKYGQLLGIGGLDEAGRRVHTLNLSKVPAKIFMENFHLLMKVLNIIWDTLTVNVAEIRAGICMICNFKDFGNSNWSIELCNRFQQMLKDRYPLTIHHIYLVDTTLFTWGILTFAMPPTLKELVQYVSRDELTKIIPKDVLPACLGGNFDKEIELIPWIVKRLEEREGNPGAR